MRIPEHIQARVYEYYYELTESMFVKNTEIFNYLSTSMSETVKIHQIKESIFKLNIINNSNIRQLESFVKNLRISFYLAGDVILKEGSENFTFYYIHKGLIEVIQQNKDFIYFDCQNVQQFLSHNNNAKREDTVEELSKKEKNESINSNSFKNKIIDPKQNTNKIAPKLKDVFRSIPCNEQNGSVHENEDQSRGNLNNSISRLLIDKNCSLTDNENLSFKSDDGLINSELVKRNKQSIKNNKRPNK